MQVASESAWRVFIAIAAQSQHQPSHRIRGIAAVFEQLFEIAITRDGLILLERFDQIVEQDLREVRAARRFLSARQIPDARRGPHTSPAIRSRHHVKQPQALRGVADLIAQIVRPAAEGIDVVEVLMQPLGQQEADDVEIFVVMGRQPARVSQRSRRETTRVPSLRETPGMRWDARNTALKG